MSNILLRDRRIFPGSASTWISNKGPEINKPESDIFKAEDASNGNIVVTNTGREKFCGALVSSTKMNLPTDEAGVPLQFVMMHARYKYPYEVYRNLARHELDHKVCYKTRPPKPAGGGENPKIRNVSNFSTQWNRDTGAIQIDLDPPGWVDSGYFVEDIEPEVWHDYMVQCWYGIDDADPRFSVLSIQLDNNDPYLVPPELQNVAQTLTNWEKCSKGQIQNEFYQPGCTVIQYSIFDFWWSNAPLQNFAVA